MATDKTSWGHFSVEIRNRILETILQNNCNWGSCAAVSREWQAVIEHHNFSRIHLTPGRIVDLNEMTLRNRDLVRYVWLRLELEEYDCVDCAPEDLEKWELSNEDNLMIVETMESLLFALSEWTLNGELLLDISVYSPSDSKHYFRYLTFEPDDPPDECALGRPELTPFHGDWPHGWSDGSEEVPKGGYDPERAFLQYPANGYVIDKVFQEIMREGPFDSDGPFWPREEEGQWWQQLPLVPAVTGVLLRQQNRRRWRPAALAHMFSCFPSLQEIHYEPWREWQYIRRHEADEGKYFPCMRSFPCCSFANSKSLTLM